MDSNLMFTPIQNLIKNGDIDSLREQLSKETKVYEILEQRNNEGKTPFFLAVELGHMDIAQYILSEFPTINVWVKDTYNGNTVLHIAVAKGYEQLTSLLFNLCPDMCL